MPEALNKRQKVFPHLPIELDHHYRKLGHNQVDRNNKPNANPGNSLIINTNANPCATTFIKIKRVFNYKYVWTCVHVLWRFSKSVQEQTRLNGFRTTADGRLLS